MRGPKAFSTPHRGVPPLLHQGNCSLFMVFQAFDYTTHRSCDVPMLVAQEVLLLPCYQQARNLVPQLAPQGGTRYIC